jgi:fructose-1,6-bisphosphatase-3
MQKAMAVMQFKLEAQLIARNPHFSLHHRDLFSQVDHTSGVIRIDANTYPLLDTVFPTVDATSPTVLNAAEQSCLAALTESFLSSPVLWRHMSYVAKKGRMHLIRDYALIFHGCVPCNEHGEFLELSIDGVSRKGKELFDAIAVAVQRAFQFKRTEDLDLLWYLWCGPLSPLFGKDKIATFEAYFIEDSATHHEEKNPYFTLIHEEWFCQKVLNEFGVAHAHGLIVNGHVPVKIEKGESPLKRCGKAVTIDGAFSEAYGDKGYTLVLQPEQAFLALHHHFTSIDDAIQRGVDMIPEIQILASYPTPRLIGDTERGREIRQEIALLELLMKAYRENRIEELRIA